MIASDGSVAAANFNPWIPNPKSAVRLPADRDVFKDIRAGATSELRPRFSFHFGGNCGIGIRTVQDGFRKLN